MEELRQQLKELQDWKASLERSSTIPLNIDQSFRGRFIKSLSNLAKSSKSSTSENQAVNEAGSATYSVLGDPDGFLEITIDGVLYYIPYFQ